MGGRKTEREGTENAQVADTVNQIKGSPIRDRKLRWEIRGDDEFNSDIQNSRKM